jgi:hypothetical protein
MKILKNIESCDVKEQRRQESNINRYDPEVTGEEPLENITNAKAKIIFKTFNEVYNNHRFSRKPMPDDIKEEYKKRCKEYSLFKMNEWRHIYRENAQYDFNEQEMYKSACLLPTHLMVEVLNPDDEGLDIEDEDGCVKDFKEESEDIEFFEYDPLFLYGQQVLRVYPDDYHILFKTLINSSAYDKSNRTGEGLEGMEGEQGQNNEEQE